MDAPRSDRIVSVQTLIGNAGTAGYLLLLYELSALVTTRQRDPSEYASVDMAALVSSLPLMDKVRGRVAEVLLLPDGSVVSGEFLTTIFDDDPALVKQFQLHQQADLSVRVRIVPGTTSDGRTKCIQVAQNNVRALTRGQVPITIELVESIPDDRGKLRFIVSDVKDSAG